MRRLHLGIGLLALAAFLATGQYMDIRHDHLRSLAPAPRLLFRSAHIYLLFASLLNLTLGLYAVPEHRPWRRWLQRVGSVLVLATPALFTAAFFVEPWLDGLERPYARPAIYISLAGVLCHLASRARRPAEAAAPRPPESGATGRR